MKKCIGVWMPEAGQDRDGGVQVSLGAKGVVELELVSSGEKWGRGPEHDIHSSLEAAVDSPSWHLVQALNTLVEKDGHTPAVEGFYDKVRPLSAEQKKMIEDYAAKTSEETVKRTLGVGRWVHDAGWVESRILLESRPTINIEGLVAGYTGPGGKTVLPHRAVAKIDMRLVPDMTAADTLAKLKAHLTKHGFADIEVNMSGGYNPTQTDAGSTLIQTQLATYRRLGVDPLLWPRSAGSWPGYVFTDAPLSLPAGHFGMGNGTGAHAPDEYYLIESTQPQGAGPGRRSGLFCRISLCAGPLAAAQGFYRSQGNPGSPAANSAGDGVLSGAGAALSAGLSGALAAFSPLTAALAFCAPFFAVAATS